MFDMYDKITDRGGEFDYMCFNPFMTSSTGPSGLQPVPQVSNLRTDWALYVHSLSEFNRPLNSQQQQRLCGFPGLQHPQNSGYGEAIRRTHLGCIVNHRFTFMVQENREAVNLSRTKRSGNNVLIHTKYANLLRFGRRIQKAFCTLLVFCRDSEFRPKNLYTWEMHFPGCYTSL
ncbi:hypothetical protein M758_3G249300 [Ceratodon purpureus]|uniref:Uncharacterized protein n=1 Tax=Ceratodon purpureus TaxID=3225 RepID=A0A8T0IPQ7_CERPU|nr:hypothetical protein KC19_3G248900 [Ceratodon purpureus]KAG0624455.1 hypothetical protein M758_3G249300 [Ceratodon purpureus]